MKALKVTLLLLIAFFAFSFSEVGIAQPFPSRPVKFLVPYPAGTAPDTMMRLLADGLSKTWKQQVLVENRAGASGIIAMNEFKKLPADGYTYMFGEVGILAINPSYYKTLPYDPEKDLLPVIDISWLPWVLFTARDGPVKSLRGLIDFAKANPGKYSYVSPGTGTPIYAVSEMFKLRAGVDLLSVPFRDLPPMLSSLASGEVTVFFTSPATVSSIANRLQPLAVASNRRLATLPNVPTIEEAGGPADFDVQAWSMLVTARNAPPAIVAKVRADAAVILKGADFTGKMGNFGFQPSREMSPEDMAQFIRSESQRYAEVIRATGARGD
jgi:tripartite-type tricarboxylate transporter receptor subunit TctC